MQWDQIAARQNGAFPSTRSSTLTSKRYGTKARASSFHLLSEIAASPATNRPRLHVNDFLVALTHRLINDGTDQVDDLFDLDASLVGFIARSQTGFRKLLQQRVNQQLAVTFEKALDAVIRQLQTTLHCNLNQ